MATDSGTDDARTALADACGARERLEGRGSWARWYYRAVASSLLGLVLLQGLIGSDRPGTRLLVSLVFFVVVSRLTAWADRQGVVARGSRRLHRSVGIVTVPLLVAAVVLDLRHPGDPVLLACVAVAVASPALVAALLVRRAAGVR